MKRRPSIKWLHDAAGLRALLDKELVIDERLFLECMLLLRVQMMPATVERKMRITKARLREYIARYNKMEPPRKLLSYTRIELFLKLLYCDPTEKKHWQSLWQALMRGEYATPVGRRTTEVGGEEREV